MTVVIAGCGDLGTEAGLSYVAAGHAVLALRRTTSVLPDSFASLSVDLATQVPSLPADTQIVVLATSADGRHESAYRSAYVAAASNIITSIQRDVARAPRVLLVSSTAVYGVDDGSWIDETTPADPRTPTASLLLEAERTLRAALPGAVVLRLGGIYGPGRGRLIEDARSGRAPERPQFTNRIHRDDAAGAIVHLTTMNRAPEPIYLGVDNEPAERSDVLRFLAGELGVEPVAQVTGRPGGKRCDNGLLHGSGFAFRFPTYREGYRSILAGQGVRHP